MESQQYKTVERIETIPPATTAASKREQEQQLINNITISNNNNKNNNKNNNNNKEPNNMSEKNKLDVTASCIVPVRNRTIRTKARLNIQVRTDGAHSATLVSGHGPIQVLGTAMISGSKCAPLKIQSPTFYAYRLKCLKSSWEYHGISWIIGVLMRTVLISISSLRVPWVPQISIQSLTDHI